MESGIINSDLHTSLHLKGKFRTQNWSSQDPGTHWSKWACALPPESTGASNWSHPHTGEGVGASTLCHTENFIGFHIPCKFQIPCKSILWYLMMILKKYLFTEGCYMGKSQILTCWAPEYIKGVCFTFDLSFSRFFFFARFQIFLSLLIFN